MIVLFYLFYLLLAVKGSEKKKVSVVGPHHSPQKPGQNGQQKMRGTDEVLGRQPEGLDQNEQLNSDEMGRR